MKKIIFLSLLILSHPTLTIAKSFRIVHYNIKELDSQKLIEGSKNEQISSVVSVLKKLRPDFLSVNELQYDLPNVPSSNFKTEGQNLARIAKLLGYKESLISTVFGPANTGLNSIRMENGSYATKPLPEFDKYADAVNFGVFPAQYSTGGLFLNQKFKIVEVKVFSELLWSEFNPNRDISKFLDANGEKLNPKTTELFDKNFSDVTVEYENKVFHIILLHTVPNHDFGKANSPNEARNGDQLAFLEWYLTGSTQFDVPNNIGIKPLNKNDIFIAMGDWNTDLKQDADSSGSKVLSRLFKKTKLWTNQLTYSYESQPFTEKPYQNLFDYMIASLSVNISGSHYNPIANRIEKGCKSPVSPQSNARKIVSYKKGTSTCYAEVNHDYYEVKKASDHHPIWADIEL